LTALLGSGLAAIYLVSHLVPAEAIQRSTSFFLGTGSGRSSNQRTTLWGEAWQLFTEHPLFGRGVGGFALRDPIYVYPHNILLEALAELGIFGFATVASFLVLAISCGVGVWRTSAGVDREEAALVLALFAMAFVNAMLSDPIEAVSGVWLAVGLIYGLRARAVAKVAVRDPVPVHPRTKALDQERGERPPLPHPI
jgi:O-antigen ligase